MRKNGMKKAVMFAMVIAMTTGAFPVDANAATTEEFTQEFKEPTKKTQANIRYWLKGSDIDEELVAKDLKAISEAGFSTIEIINKGGSTQDLSEYGWGTEEWQKATEIIIQEAEKNNLSVDFTIGPTWPAAIPNLDVNDEAASQQLVSSSQQISASDFTEEDGKLTYTCAVPAGPESETEQTLIAVVLGKLTGDQRTDSETFYAAASGEKQEVDFTVDVLDEESMTVVTPDEEGNVKLELESGATGDYVLFAFYSQGTGQTVSGSTDPDAVCIDHYSKAGTEALLNYWEDHILDDTLTSYLSEKGGDLFEDSLELTTNVTPWTKGLLDSFKEERGYDLEKYLPMLINRFYSAANSASGEGGVDESQLHCYGFGDASDKKIVADFNELLDTLYQENHLKVVNSWAEEHGMNYRVQAYSGYDTGHYDSNQAATMVGTIEGESLAFMESQDGVDGFRMLSGGAHAVGKQVVSDELGAVLMGTYNQTFDDVTRLINLNAAGGANQFVFHGYPSSCETETEEWPGYHPFGMIFSEPWDDRQPVWDSMNILTDYMARTQGTLQEGTAKIDVAVLRDEKKIKAQYFDSDNLTENGYSYEFLSDDTMLTAGVEAVDGVLTPDSAAYKALVLYNETALSTDMLNRLKEYADNGLTIVVVGEAPSEGKYFNDANDVIASGMEELLAKDNVYQIEDAETLSETLKNAGITPAAEYKETAQVHSLHRSEDGTDYYWFYNYGEDSVDLNVALEGKGNSYQMNLWNGKVTKLDNSAEDAKVDTAITLEAGEATVVMLSEDEVEAEEAVSVETSEAVSLKDNTWTLDVESYTAEKEGSPETKITEISNELTGLLPWAEIQGLETVSGKGTYKTTVTVDSLENVKKAVLDMTAGSGTMAVTGVIVNGEDAGRVDQSEDSVDITGYLTEGENTIEISVATTLANAVNGTSDSEYGLTDAQIVLEK